MWREHVFVCQPGANILKTIISKSQKQLKPWMMMIYTSSERMTTAGWKYMGTSTANRHVFWFLGIISKGNFFLPSWELTYPIPRHFWRWYPFSRLVWYVSFVPWRVSSWPISFPRLNPSRKNGRPPQRHPRLRRHSWPEWPLECTCFSKGNRSGRPPKTCRSCWVQTLSGSDFP